MIKFNNKALEAEYLQVRARALAMDEADHQIAQAQTAQALQSRPYAIDERVFGVAREQTPTSLPNPFDSFRPSARFDLKPAVTPAEYYKPFYTVGFSPNARPAQTESEIQRLWDHAFPTMANVTLPGRQFGPVQEITQDQQRIDGALARIRGQNARYDTALSNLTAQANQAAQNTAWGIVDQGAETAVANAQKVFGKIDADWYASRREALEMLGEQPAAQIRKLAEAEQGYKAGTAPEVYLALREQLENAYGAELLDSLLEYVRMEENAKRMENARAEAYQRGQKSGWHSLRNIGTVPQKLVGGVVGTAEALGQGLVNAVTGNNRPLDLNTPAQEATARADAFRSGAQEDMSGVGRFVYGTAMSLADSGVAILTGQPWILGTAAANSTMQEVKRNGGSESQALTMGVIAGVTEMLTEKLSIDSLFQLSDAKTVKDMLWNAVKQALPEAAEETVSSVVNLLADDVVMGEKSRYNQLIQSGMTDKQAFLELAKEVGLNALGGGLSGFVMGSVKSAVDLAANPNTQAETAEQTEAPQTAEPAQAAQAVTPEQKPEAQTVQTPKTTAQIMEEAAQGMVGKPDGLVGSDTADGVGAKNSDFKHRVVDSQNHALGGVEARNAVPEDLRTQTTHDEITEAESLHNANLRLEQDYEGEKRYLENTVSWTGEDVDVGMKILEDLSREAHNTGDWTEYTRWRKVFDLHKEEIGRSLQALAKYARLTGDRIIENASKLLDDARDGTDVSEVMDTVATFSAAFDEAAAKKDVDQLVQIIRDTAQTRNMSGLVRSVFGKSGLPKEIDWAINRIAELAVGDLQKYEANPTAAPVVRRFSVGDRVSPSDRNNVGTIVADHGDGTYSVRFVNPKTKAETTKKFSVEQLQPTDKTKKNSLSFPAEKHDVGKYYDFLKKFAANSIEAIAADKKKLSGGKAAKTLRYNAMLSKASTVLRNLVNNGVLDGLDTLARDASVPLDMLISSLTGTRSVAVDKGWFSEAKRKGALDGLAFALMECGLDVDTSGSYNKYENGAGRTFKMSGGPVERLLSSWEKLTAYNMSVTDEVSKGATEAEIQRGIDELRAKGKIKDDSLGGAGAQEARYRTLQDDTVLSKAASKIREVGNDIYSIDGFGLGDLALPFTKVPANVPMRVIDYSPAGLATGMFRMAQVLKSAKDGTLTAAEQARAVQSIGRGMTGTAVIAGLTALAAKGLIRTMDAGGKEENRDRAASLKSQGLFGTQWNLSAALRDAVGKESGWKDGDTILSVGFLEPFNAHMAIASLIAEDMKDGLTAGEIVTDTLSGTVQAVLELPVMQVFQDAANAYRYSDGETAGERFLDAGKSFLAGQATSWIPNSLKGIAQGLDPMQRDLYTSDNPLEQAVDNFKGSIPKLREQTSAKLDVYGNPVENENRAMNFLNANVNPGSVGTYQTTPTTDVLNRVYEATGESSVYLSSSDLSEVKDVALDESQKRQFQTDRGDTYEAVVPAIGGDKNFWDLPNKMQVAILSVAEEYATQTAKEKLGVGYETESWVQELAGKSAEEIARECIKKGVERVGGLGKPIKFDASWAVVSGDVMDGAMKKAQAYADAVALEEMGYPMETDWMLKAKEAKTDKERQDLFMAAAVDAQAKELGDGNKYVGLSEMLEDGDVDDKVALLVLPPDVVKRKTDRKIKVSATLLVDALAFKNSDAASSGKKDKNGKYLDGEGPQDKVLEYLRKDRRLPTSQVNKVMACLYEGWGR